MPAESSKLRFVDTHVHHWDPAKTEWYPHLAADFDLSAVGAAGAERMKRRYLVEEYLSDVEPWGMQKYVHVSAISGSGGYLEEAGWVLGLGGPVAAVIGTVDLKLPKDKVLSELAAQAELAQFRGIRNLKVPDPHGEAFLAALDFLSERDLVYDYVVHPDRMASAASVLRRIPTLRVVIEHCGWPTATDDEHRARWRAGLRELAAVGPQVHCKITGLAMATHTVEADVNRPWLDDVLDIFGVERCLAGSNLPVDSAFGSVTTLMQTLLDTVAARDAAAVQAVFADNAERVYRI